MIDFQKPWLWMFRLLLISFFFSLSLFATALTSRYTLLAEDAHQEGNILFAQGDVLIYSKEYSFRADRVRYDKVSGDLSLFGNVDIKHKDELLTRLAQTTFNLKNKAFVSQGFFAYHPKSEIWFDAKKTKAKEDTLILKETTLSSCNVADPDWQIRFSKGVYDQKHEYLSLYNPRFYVGKVPILYLPWFGFSTNKTRKTGFLRPILGFESRDNVFLVLPFYIAEEKSWDFEIDPQIRLRRGAGIYATLRFVDSNHSSGRVDMGFFNESRQYFQEKGLKNRLHSGIEFFYKSHALFTEPEDKNSTFRDGLFIDTTYLNDIDYINLDHKTGWAQSKLVESKANYVYYGDRDFMGVYAKYFIDTEKTSNADTLQTLPSIQYHSFSQTLKIPNLLYAFDYKFKNNYRRRGLNAKQHELFIPLTFYKTLFGEYLNFQASENFYYSRVNYSKGNITTKNANYFSNYHKLTLASDLTKRYTSYIHNLQLEVGAILPSFEKKSGYFADFIPFNLETKSLSFKINQFYYDMSGFNFLTHRVRQILYDDETLYKYSDLENQVIYRFSKDFMVHNTLFYSHQYDRIRKLQTGLNYHDKKYDLGFNHTYEYRPLEKNTNFITSHINAKIDKNYDIFASLDYDIEESFTKEWTLGWQMKKRCWDYKFRYKQSVTPSLTPSGTQSLIRRGVLLFVRFSPFGGLSYNYTKESPLDLENVALENLAHKSQRKLYEK